MGILDEANKAIEQMSPEEIAKEFALLTEQRAKRQEKQKEYNAKPENKEKRKKYSEEYRQKDPEGFAAKRKAYMQKPEVKARHKEYMKARNERNKLLIAKAKELGLDKTASAPPTGTATTEQASA
jgi:hypothetical protein